MKKIMALTLMLIMLVSTVCFAAVSSSGSKSSSPSSSSKSSTSTPSLDKQTAPSGSYQPTAPANSYSNTAPAKQATPSAQQSTQPQSSTSSFWRNASMIGGGMLAGSMLGSLFGNNNMGGESSFFGMLINFLIIGGVVMGIRHLWDKYKNRNRQI